MDPFAFIELEGGEISESQQQCLLHFPHDAVFLPTYQAALRRARPHVSAPVVLPSTSRATSQPPPASPGVLRLGSPPPLGGDPHGDREDLGSPGGGNEEVRASTKRSRDTQVNPPEFPTKSPRKGDGNLGFGFGGEPWHASSETTPSDVTGRGESNKLNRGPSEVLNLGNQNAASKMILGPRKLPASITNPPREKGTSCRSRAPERSPENPSATLPPVADDLLSMMLLVSDMTKKRKKRLVDTDIFNILKMKGLEFPPPWWSRPGLL